MTQRREVAPGVGLASRLWMAVVSATRALVLSVFLVGMGFSWGVISMHWKIFPYDQLETLRRQTLFEDDPRARFLKTDERIEAPLTEAQKAKAGVFMTFGQSNAANYGQFGYQAGAAVVNFFDGRAYRYEDPALGANGRFGSVWGRLGDRLVAEGRYETASFTLAAIGGRSLGKLRRGAFYAYFLDAYRKTERHFGRVDAILMHQGEANHSNTTFEEYGVEFAAFLTQLRKDGVAAPIYLSQATFCQSNGVDRALSAAQDAMIRKYEGVLRGPNTDLLIEPEFRTPDGCHFSAAGLDAFAELWFDSLSKASED